MQNFSKAKFTNLSEMEQHTRRHENAVLCAMYFIRLVSARTGSAVYPMQGLQKKSIEQLNEIIRVLSLSLNIKQFGK